MSQLRDLKALSHLAISGCPAVRDLTPLAGLPLLARLELGRNTPLKGLESLTELATLAGDGAGNRIQVRTLIDRCC